MGKIPRPAAASPAKILSSRGSESDRGDPPGEIASACLGGEKNLRAGNFQKDPSPAPRAQDDGDFGAENFSKNSVDKSADPAGDFSKTPTENFSKIPAADPSPNPAQAAAIAHRDGPALVLAGPGTGKTQVLTLRIAELLKKTDGGPGSILALTFTESGARAMRERLARFVGAEAYRVAIHTFHGFALRIIREHPAAFPWAREIRPADDLDRRRIFRELLESGKFPDLLHAKNPEFFLSSVARAISDLKREGFDPARFRALLEKEKSRVRDEIAELAAAESRRGQPATVDLGDFGGPTEFATKTNAEKARRLAENFSRLPALADFFEKYQTRLAAENLADFDDQILALADALETDPDLPWEIRERFLYFLVDEFQDTSGAQLRILDALTGGDPAANLFAVGDDDQAIYRFQGASAENFSWFLKKFPGAARIVLTENYRSGQKLLDAARPLSGGGGDFGVEKTLRAAAGPGETPEIWDFPDADSELAGVAGAIRAAIDAGENPSEIAVLFRKNKTAPEVAAALSRENIPYFLADDRDALGVAEVRGVLTWLRWLAAPGRTDLLALAALGPASPLGPRDRLEVALKRDAGGVREFLLGSEGGIFEKNETLSPPRESPAADARGDLLEKSPEIAALPPVARNDKNDGAETFENPTPAALPPTPALRTARLALRPRSAETARAGFEILRAAPDEFFARDAWERPTDFETFCEKIWLGWSEAADPSFRTWDVFVGDRLAGGVIVRTHGGVAFWTTPELAGRGIATEAARAALDWAFENGLARAWLGTAADNFASQKVAQKLGFRPIPGSTKWEKIAGNPALENFQKMALDFHAAAAAGAAPSDLFVAVLRGTECLKTLLEKNRPGPAGEFSQKNPADPAGSGDPAPGENPAENLPEKNPAAKFPQKSGENPAAGDPDPAPALEALAAAHRFFRAREAARPGADLAGLLADLDALRAEGKILPFSLPAAGPAVVLATAHRAKGLEWRRVFLVRAVDGEFGGNRAPSSPIRLPDLVGEEISPEKFAPSPSGGGDGVGVFDKKSDPAEAEISQKIAVTPDPDEDEKRLFFVALTRAREKCVVSWARRPDPASTRENLPSRFLAEIGPDFFRKIEKPAADPGQIFTEKSGENPAADPARPGDFFTPAEVARLHDRLADFALSPSALGAFRDCGLRFAFSFLLRIPTPAAPAQALGTAVHRALEKYFSGAERDFLKTLRESFAREKITPAIREKLFTESAKMLEKFLPARADLGPPAALEKSVRANFDGISLKGKIDRLDAAGPGEFLITDWKTGRKKSAREIFAEDGRELEQLLFYRLLVEADPTLRGEVRAGRVDFVGEPGARVEVDFREIGEREAAFRARLREDWARISAGDFHPTADPEICKKCDFRESCPRARG